MPNVLEEDLQRYRKRNVFVENLLDTVSTVFKLLVKMRSVNLSDSQIGKGMKFQNI